MQQCELWTSGRFKHLRSICSVVSKWEKTHALKKKYLKLIGKDNKDLKRLNRKVLVIHLIKYAKHSAASLTNSIEKELRNDNIKYTKKHWWF